MQPRNLCETGLVSQVRSGRLNPRGRRPSAFGRPRRSRHVSIHASAREATPLVADRAFPLPFQSTPPRGRRRLCLRREMLTAGVSIHAAPDVQLDPIAHMIPRSCLDWPWVDSGDRLSASSRGLGRIAPMNLTLRCYARVCENQWHAICTDLDVAADGPSVEEAKASLAACHPIAPLGGGAHRVPASQSTGPRVQSGNPRTRLAMMLS